MRLQLIILPLVALLLAPVPGRSDCPVCEGAKFKYYGRLIPFKSKGRYGYRFPRGKIIVPAQFDEARPLFPRGHPTVELTDHMHTEKYSGLGCTYTAPVRLGKRWHLLEINICDEYRLSRVSSETGLFPAGKGYLDTGGRFIDPGKRWNLRVQRISLFSEGRALIGIHDHSYSGFALIDDTLTILKRIPSDIKGIPRSHEMINPASLFHEGFALYSVQKKVRHRPETWRHHFGYLDREGNTVIPARFLLAETFHQGKARVVYITKRYETVNGCYSSACWYAQLPCLFSFLLVTRSPSFAPDRGYFDETHKLYKDDEIVTYGLIDTRGRMLFSTPVRERLNEYVEKTYPGWLSGRPPRHGFLKGGSFRFPYPLDPTDASDFL